MIFYYFLMTKNKVRLMTMKVKYFGLKPDEVKMRRSVQMFKLTAVVDAVLERFSCTRSFISEQTLVMMSGFKKFLKIGFVKLIYL